MEVVKLIKGSLKELKKISWEKEISDKSPGSKLIFPKYCVGKETHRDTKRISEQEARFLFVRELEKPENEHSFYYSIETPTLKSYKNFSNDKTPEITEQEGRSGSVDVTLYTIEEDDTFCRKHLIEFKFGNVKTCRKDFLKLLCDDEQCKINYYINIIDNCNNHTTKSVKSKFKKSIKYIIGEKYPIYSELRIFVFIYGENKDKELGEKNFLEYRFLNGEFEEIRQETI